MDERQKLALAVAVSGAIGLCGGAALSALLFKRRKEDEILSRRSSPASCGGCSGPLGSISRINNDVVDDLLPGGDTAPTRQLPELVQLIESNKQMSETLKMLEAKISHMDSVLKSRNLSRSSSSLGGYATANESPDLSDEEFSLADNPEFPPRLSVDEHSGDEIYFNTQTVAKPKTLNNEKTGILKGATRVSLETRPPEPTVSEPSKPLLPDYEYIDNLLCSEKTEENREGFELLTQLRQENSSLDGQAVFLWRISKATHQRSLASNESEQKKALAFQAKELAFQALSAPSGVSLADVHKWCAITVGNIGDYVSIPEKISNGSIFKQRIDEAIRLNPNDEMSHYLMGRWCYSVYMMSWVERKVATSLVPDFPQTSMDEALQAFQKAETCSPGFWVDNQLYIAKSFIEKGSCSQAMMWLDTAADLPRKNEDAESHNEVDKLRAKYSSYRSH